MKETVIHTIRKHNLIPKNSKVLLALSGGSDSVCLLHILNDLKIMFDFELYACHLNHSIRSEADEDCRFVESLCQSLGVEFFAKKVDIKAIAKSQKISEELAGRNERYDFFEEVLKKREIDLIATAHNKNDSAETILMHIIRGSGIDGLTGIAYQRGNIIRPLLDCLKCDIEKYCEDNKYSFVVDKTNNQSIYTRNKIRLELIPQICKGFNPSFISTIVKNADLIRDDADYLGSEAERIYSELEENGRLNIVKLKTLHPAMQRRIILIMYKRYFGNTINMQSVHVESIMGLIRSGHSGKSVNICKNTRCVLEFGSIFFKENKDDKSEYSYRIELDTPLYIPEAGMSITLKNWEGVGEKFFFEDIKKLCVRNRRQGDVFYPEKMKGRKKLSDYFTDRKIPGDVRNILPIITYNDEIVWIVGKRRDRRFLAGEKAYTFILD